MVLNKRKYENFLPLHVLYFGIIQLLSLFVTNKKRFLPVGLVLRSLLVGLVDTRNYCYYLWIPLMKYCFLHSEILHYMMIWYYKPQMQRLQLKLNWSQMRYPKPLNEMVNKMVHLCPSFAIELQKRKYLFKHSLKYFYGVRMNY